MVTACVILMGVGFALGFACGTSIDGIMDIVNTLVSVIKGE